MNRLRHYVLLKYKPGTPERHVTEFCSRMLALKGQIAEIISLEIGRDILHEARSWDLILVMAFDSTAALRLYQQHEAHQAVMEFNAACVADVAAIDFELPLLPPGISAPWVTSPSQ
jgi:hypothetical protein